MKINISIIKTFKINLLFFFIKNSLVSHKYQKIKLLNFTMNRSTRSYYDDFAALLCQNNLLVAQSKDWPKHAIRSVTIESRKEQMRQICCAKFAKYLLKTDQRKWAYTYTLTIINIQKHTRTIIWRKQSSLTTVPSVVATKIASFKLIELVLYIISFNDHS